jgi:peptide/nickel transport system substrate-binding protein
MVKNWINPYTKDISLTIKSFRLSERVVFYFLLIVFIFSALFLLFHLNNSYSEAVPVSGGTLQEGVIGYPRYINPVLAITDPGRDLTDLIYAGLMRQTPSGELVPDLAASYTISNDGLTYDFLLKDNLTFQDGSPLTGDDVEFTILKTQDQTLNSPRAANWSGVSVEKVSAKEIKFHLKKPYGPFLQNTTIGILPKRLWSQATDADSFTLSDLNRNPVGAGPYMIKGIKTTGAGLPEYYHLVPFRNYAGGSAYIKDIILRFYNNEEDLLNAYNRGEIQAVNSISPEETEYLKSRNTEILTKPLPRVFGVFLNQSQDPVLVHSEVRQALNSAVDRKVIIEKVLNGYGSPIYNPIPENLLPASTTPEDISASDRITVARNILLKAGWGTSTTGALQKKSKSGTETLHLSISTGDSPDLIATANLLKETWEALGFSVDVKTFSANDLNQNVIRPRKYDALLFGEIIPAGLDIFGFWHSSERNDPGLNIALYANSKADKLLEAARTTSDPNLAATNYLKFENEVRNDVPAVFLYSPDFIYAVPKNLHGIELGNITVPADRFMNVSKWYIETEKVWKVFTNKK